MRVASPFYGTLISPRSRRLRTTGLLLLGVVLAMAAYGSLVMMPGAHRVAVRHHALLDRFAASDARLPDETQQQYLAARQTVRAVKVAVLGADLYWGACGLLLVILLVVAWMDVREVSTLYASQRLAIWSQVAAENRKRDGPID